jgi:hypothetical protein
MSHSNPSAKTQSQNSANNDGTVEVLYQKMGDRWFAFSLVGDDVFVGSLTDEEIAGERPAGAERVHRITGNT